MTRIFFSGLSDFKGRFPPEKSRRCELARGSGIFGSNQSIITEMNFPVSLSSQVIVVEPVQTQIGAFEDSSLIIY
jgi:hypothetical protein